MQNENDGSADHGNVVCPPQYPCSMPALVRGGPSTVPGRMRTCHSVKLQGQLFRADNADSFTGPRSAMMQRE